MNTTVLWHDRETLGVERCTLTSLESGFHLRGMVLCPVEGTPVQSAYTVTVDANWHTRHVAVHVETPHTVADLVLTADGTGTWWRDGEALPGVIGCLDVDLGITPATNTLPIRRLQLRPGEGADIGVVWVAFPSLRVARRDQRYDRLSVSRYRYHSGIYTAELVVDEQGAYP